MGKTKLQKAAKRYITAQSAMKTAVEKLLQNPKGEKEIKAHKTAQERVKKEHLEVGRLTDEKAAADKVAADKVAADKVAADKVAADKKAADDKAAADKKEADEKAAVEKKEVDDKAAAEKRAEEEDLPEAYVKKQKEFEDFIKDKRKRAKTQYKGQQHPITY